MSRKVAIVILLVGVLLGLVLLASCETPTPGPISPSPSTEQPSQSTTPEPTPMLAQMETIVKSDVCGIGTKKQVVIDTQAAWEELWVAAGFDRMLLEPSPPIVDFSQETVIAVFSGSHGSTGYHIEITEIRITEDEVTIVFKERSSQPGSAVGNAFTQPYHIVKTKSFGWRTVTFMEDK